MLRRKPRGYKSHNAQPSLLAQTAHSFQKVLQSVPVDEMQQNILANEMVIWVRDTDAFCIEEFPLNKLMSPTQFLAVAEVNEYFKHALDFTRWAISYRLKNGWKSGKMDQNFCIRTLPQYDYLYREYQLQRAKSQAEGASQGAVINVITKAIPDSPLVKKRGSV